MKGSHSSVRASHAYVRACVALARVCTRVRTTQGTPNGVIGSSGLDRALSLSGLPIDAGTVNSASVMAGLLSGSLSASASILCVLLYGIESSLVLILMTLMVPLVVREIIRSYPRMMSRGIAAEVMKDSTGAITLMVMCLRKEPSLPSAISFSCTRKDRFTDELRACTWGVIMGRFASFEDALHNLAERWSEFGSELKTAIDALITASCEATEDGRRRALDRANNASVSAVKRRIEEYALSLSTPSMVMFGLAILLPLMVGSFLPMLSWDVWSSSSGAMGPDITTEPIGMVQVAFIMNALFPAIGLLVAMGSVTRHPLESAGASSDRISIVSWRMAAVSAISSFLLAALGIVLLQGVREAAAVLLSVTAPVSIMLISIGIKRADATGTEHEASEEALFRTGARMIEGENFESALFESCRGRSGSLRAFAEGSLLSNSQEDLRSSVSNRMRRSLNTQALEAFSVVKDAAMKDERAAGLLAMDLATYIRDLRETERSLRSRLKPTISMMKVTSFALTPVVLGVTFAMYMTLGAIAGNGAGSLDPAMFFLVLGAFLAESNAVVQYFIWGVEGRRTKESLAASLGACMIISELIYVATAIIAG